MIDGVPYLHRITVPTPFPVGPVNLYLAEGEPLTLVDTGPRFEPAREGLVAALATLGYTLSDLGRVLISHAHSDHCGLAAECVAASGAELLTHPANFVELGDYRAERNRRLLFYAGLMRESGVPLHVLARINRTRRRYGQYAQPARPDGPLDEGMVVRLGGEDWQVLHTPGHTGGVVCFYQPQRRLLLSSDHLLRDISSNPIVEPPPTAGAERPRRLVDYVAQLQRVAALPVDLALPGHGPPIDDVAGLVARRLAFHAERAQALMGALGGREHTAYQLSLAIFPHLDAVNRFLALSEIIGHLEWLEMRGQVVSRLKGRTRLWRRATG